MCEITLKVPKLAEMQEQTSMAFCELYPIVMACVLWGHQWSRLRIVFYCDNMSTVEITNKGRSKIPSIMKLMRMKHIEGVKNNLADVLSQF